MMNQWVGPPQTLIVGLHGVKHAWCAPKIVSVNWLIINKTGDQ